MTPYVMTLAIFSLINVGLASAFNLTLGYAGLFSAAQAAFYGAGAYVSALTMLRLHWPFPGALLAATLFAGAMGAAAGRLSIRFGGHYLVIATLALQFLVLDVMANTDALTGGRIGLPGIPRPAIFGLSFNSLSSYLALAATIVGLQLLVVFVLLRSPWGRLLRALREDEIALASLGKNVNGCKIAALAIGSGLTGVSGSLYAHFVGALDPSAFDLPTFVAIVAMVIVGGSGTIVGPILGAVALTTIPEVIRFLGVSGIYAGQVRQLVYAGMLTLILIYRPGGFVPQRTMAPPSVD